MRQCAHEEMIEKQKMPGVPRAPPFNTRAYPLIGRGKHLLFFLSLLLSLAASWTCLPNGDIAIGAAIYPTSLLPPLSVTFPGSPPNYNLTLCTPFSPHDISPACAGAPAFACGACGGTIHR